MPPVTQFYDVCVLGNERVGLLAGALLAKRGCRVALVQPADDVSGSSSCQAHHVELGNLTQLGALPHVQRIHQELGLPRPRPSEFKAQATPELTLQMVDAHHRVDVRGSAALAQELQREFPEHGDQVGHFCRRLLALDAEISARLSQRPLGRRHGRLYPKLPRRRGAAALLQPFSNHPIWQELPARHPLRRLTQACLSLLGAPQPTAYAGIRLLAQLWRQAQPLHAPAQVLDAAGLREIGQRHGAELYAMADPPRLQMQGNRLSGLQTNRGPLRAARFIDALDTPLSALLPAEPPTKGIRGWLRRWSLPIADRLATEEAAATPRQGLWETQIGMAAEAVPDAMAPCVIVAPAAAGDLALRVHIQNHGDRRVLFVRCLTPTLGPPTPAAEAAMGRQIARLMPFYSHHLGDEAGQPWSWRPLGRGLLPASIDPLCSLRTLRTCIKNLWWGGDLVPELGREGTYLAGDFLAHALAGRG
jgi:hypothetical protein